MLRSVNYKTQRVVNYKIVLIPILLAIAIQIQGCRAIWQKPDTIIENLKLDSTTIIADIGAGDGYFTFRFEKAIGSAGKVYAIEIDYQKYELLVREVEERGSSTVFPILGQTNDPLIPEKADILFLCHAFHHIEDRVNYFIGLKKYLKEGGRVAIVELDRVPWYLGSLQEHQTPIAKIELEMSQAGYFLIEASTSLPLQNFLVFRIK
jgi:arsenite methyltransferase